MTYPPSRAYRSRVLHVVRLTRHFTRITFTGEELQFFGTRGLDQRIKLILPLPDGSFTDVGLFEEPRPPMMTWYARWRALPDAERNPMRTYTVRAVRPASAEIDVDFVLHGAEGPASAWAETAAPGDELVIVGPDSRSTEPGGGVEWRPGLARRVLLAGDETAAPAICAILERLPAHVEGLALIEVPTIEDALPTLTPSGVEVRWLTREGAAPGSALRPAVEQWGRDRARGGGVDVDLADPSASEILWEAPEAAQAEEYAWLAGEAGVITSLRRHLVRDLGWDRAAVAFMGYWRAGRSEGA